MNVLFPKVISIRALVVISFFAVVLGSKPVLGATPTPENVFTASENLPITLKRVLMLPLAHEDSPSELTSGCEMLAPVLETELIKTKKFEVVAASPKSIQALSGQPTWSGAEILPPDFFGSLQRVYGCDAVLFCQLSTFHAYPPLVIGWRLKLVDLTTQKIIWATDVVYDAGDPVVSKNAEAYQKQQQGASKPSTFFRRVVTWLNREPEPATDDQWTILNSPRYFGEFTASTLLQTLPKR